MPRQGLSSHVLPLNPFPGYQKKLTWLRGDSGGNFYKLDDPPAEGWICPAMFKYYKTPPREIYVKAESKRGRARLRAAGVAIAGADGGSQAGRAAVSCWEDGFDVRRLAR